jgi:hypothetical protein
MENNFASLALEFVKELSEVIPEEPVFAKCVKNFDSYDPKQFLVDTIGDHQSLAISKDEKLFDHVSVPGVNIKVLWSTLSDTTKESIWAYISTLTMLASALDNTPKELMTGIESLAQEFSEKMQHGELNMETLFSDVMDRVQQMDLSSMKDLDVASLTKSMGIDPSMISNMMGGMDPSIIQNMMGMMGGGGGEEDDLLKLLETAQRPQLPAPKKTKKPKSSSSSSKKKSKSSKK